MVDLKQTIVPKSDQLNADDLIAGTLTITVTKVSLLAGEQPISISYSGDNGHPFKPCKSMRRVMVMLWGADGSAYVGRSMTLYRDDKVKFGGADVGGIRISHMSHISEAVTVSLTASKAIRKPFTVRPLETNKEPCEVEYITADQAILLDDMLKGKDALKAEFLITGACESIARLPAKSYKGAMKWLEVKLGEGNG